MKPRGTKDIFGKRKEIFSFVEKQIEKVANSFNFQSIETPTFEFKDTYTKTVGNESDIVTKEMYVFKDRKQREFALRPEGTAGIVRAVVENKLLPQGNNYLKLFYFGSFFRYERPQKGRQREFHQAGFETFGPKNTLVDIEMILLGKAILDQLKIPFRLQINSLGSVETRKKYQDELKNYFKPFETELSVISKKRITKNPLRILDDKEEQQKDFVKKAPLISDFYSQEESAYFENLTSFLKKMNVSFEINNLLVRGLDYYTSTVFEFVSTNSSSKAKDTLIGGGRYDNIISLFSKEKAEAVGLGIGIERIVNEIEDLELFHEENKNGFFVLNIDKESSFYAFEIVQKLRSENFWVETNLNKTLNYTKGLQKAEKLNAKYILIIDRDSQQNESLIIKDKNGKKKISFEEFEKILKGIKDEENIK